MKNQFPVELITFATERFNITRKSAGHQKYLGDDWPLPLSYCVIYFPRLVVT
jgi:hypothetical protein